VIAITKLEKSPTRGSTPAKMLKLIASGISASATTKPARDSLRSSFGLLRASRTVGRGRYRGSVRDTSALSFVFKKFKFLASLVAEQG
jgi:hypothetical protein